MEVKVIRQEITKDSTFGQLYIDGKYMCETLEDLDRGKAPKIKHQTAIPVGTYNLVITMSPRFKRLMPLIENVPNFEGVRLHCGVNHTHTSGCLLVGMNRIDNSLTESRKAYDLVFPILKEAQDNGEKISITILRNYPEPNAHLGIS